MEYRYDVTQFMWDKETNSFYGDAPHLECIMPDGNIHPEAFPNQKGQFFIDNSNTGGFRRFRFIKETTSDVVDIDNKFNYSVTNWLFESEDGIKCYIMIGENMKEDKILVLPYQHDDVAEYLKKVKKKNKKRTPKGKISKSYNNFYSK